jgi:hypothetical protein
MRSIGSGFFMASLILLNTLFFFGCCVILDEPH